MDDLARRIRIASKLSGNFTLRSGRVSDTYFDKYRFEADPALLLAIANAMAPLILADHRRIETGLRRMRLASSIADFRD
jgi:orotate phosphoribosyltransferase